MSVETKVLLYCLLILDNRKKTPSSLDHVEFKKQGWTSVTQRGMAQQ